MMQHCSYVEIYRQLGKKKSNIKSNQKSKKEIEEKKTYTIMKCTVSCFVIWIFPDTKQARRSASKAVKKVKLKEQKKNRVRV